MASFESGDAPQTSGWRDLLMSLAAGLRLSGCLSSLPDVAQMLKEVSFGKPASSDENLVNKGYREIEAGNYAYAEIYLDSALSINPSNPFALLNLAEVYEKTVRENEARALYTALIRQSPPDIAGAVLMDENFGRGITEIARENLAALDRAVIARAARNADSPIEVSLEPMHQNLESDWRSRMDERISILQDLYAEGFLSEDELMARLGGAWSRSHGEASPDISEISLRLEALESLLQRGMISSQGYAVERGHVLDDLAPIMAMPEGRSPQSHTAAAPPGEMLQAEAQAEAPKGDAQQPPPVPHETAAAAEGAHVHLASYRSEKAARRGWKTLKKRHGDLLGNLSSRVNEVDLGPGKGVYFRVEAGPLRDQKSAVELCKKLKTRKMFCTVTV